MRIWTEIHDLKQCLMASHGTCILKKSFKICSLVTILVIGIKYVIFVNKSTRTRIELKDLEHGRSIMRSIEINGHGLLKIGSGCNNHMDDGVVLLLVHTYCKCGESFHKLPLLWPPKIFWNKFDGFFYSKMSCRWKVMMCLENV